MSLGTIWTAAIEIRVKLYGNLWTGHMLSILSGHSFRTRQEFDFLYPAKRAQFSNSEIIGLFYFQHVKQQLPIGRSWLPPKTSSFRNATLKGTTSRNNVSRECAGAWTRPARKSPAAEPRPLVLSTAKTPSSVHRHAACSVPSVSSVTRTVVRSVIVHPAPVTRWPVQPAVTAGWKHWTV